MLNYLLMKKCCFDYTAVLVFLLLFLGFAQLCNVLCAARLAPLFRAHSCFVSRLNLQEEP